MPRRTRKVHNKTFSGCWTCKSKHVKCDEAKPECLRCQRSGWICEGYDVRLSWTRHRGPYDFPSPSPDKRRASFGGTAAPTLSLVSSSDQRISVAGAIQDDGSPNDVYPDQPQNALPHPMEGISLRDPGHINRPASSGNSDIALREPSCLSVAGNASDASDGLSRPQTPNIAGHTYTRIQWLPPYKCPTVPPSPTNTVNQVGIVLTEQPYASTYLDSLPNPGLDCELIQHWNLELCDALNPVPGIHNPLRTIVSPIALDGAQKSSSVPAAATALFHLVCSAAAFHLAKVRHESNNEALSFEKCGLQHHNLGIRYLSENIHSKDKHQFTAVLASLLMCLLNEAITVPTPFWRLHIRGAVEWLNQIDHQAWQQSEDALIMYQMFVGMAIFMQSQLLPDERNWPVWDIHSFARLPLEPYSLEEVLGLPKQLLQVIYTMNAYQARIQQSNIGSSPQSPEQQRRELDRMELEILLSAPRRKSLSVGKEYAEMIYHHGYTYYYATIIYLRRTIKDVPLEEVQPLIEQSFIHLEALTRLSNRPFCPVLWPIAFIAFEAGSPAVKQRMLTYLTFFHQKSQLAIWEGVMDLVERIWTRRESSDCQNLKWHMCLPFSSAECMLI